MCVKLLPGDLNPGPCPPHPTSTYTCGVTIAPRVCIGGVLVLLKQYNVSLFNCERGKFLDVFFPICHNILNCSQNSEENEKKIQI